MLILKSTDMMQLRKRVLRRLYTLLIKLKGAKIGNKSVIDYRCDIPKAKGVILGDKTIIYKCVTFYNIGHGQLKLGNRSHIAPYAYILTKDNNIIIGDDVAIGPYCSFFCHSNSLTSTDGLFRESYIDDDITIGNNVFIGAQTVLTAGTEIGDNVAVGANSVVKGKLESGYLYAGSPVKKIRKLKDKE